MVINSGDLRYLLILNNYDTLPDQELLTQELLTQAWYNIYNEFSETVGGNRADLWLMKQKQLIAMKLKYEHDASVLRTVQQLPHPELIELAKEFGYNIDLKNFKPTFEKAYTQLMRVKNQIKSIESEQVTEKREGDLDGLITTLERHQGYQFDENTMTVKKFANIYKSYKDAQDR